MALTPHFPPAAILHLCLLVSLSLGLSPSLHVSVSLFLSVSVSICLSFSLSLRVCLSLCLSHLSLSLYQSLSVWVQLFSDSCQGQFSGTKEQATLFGMAPAVRYPGRGDTPGIANPPSAHNRSLGSCCRRIVHFQESCRIRNYIHAAWSRPDLFPSSITLFTWSKSSVLTKLRGASPQPHCGPSAQKGSLPLRLSRSGLCFKARANAISLWELSPTAQPPTLLHPE